jgi:hypothetical protein
MATTLNAPSLNVPRLNALLPASKKSGAFARTTIPPRQSLLNRLFAALIMARQRQAERDVARYIATTGGKFTDAVEREIARRLS